MEEQRIMKRREDGVGEGKYLIKNLEIRIFGWSPGGMVWFGGSR